MAHRGRKVGSLTQDEHDPLEYRKRVQTFSDGNSVSYEDDNFTSADTLSVLAINTDLGRLGHHGYLVNDGPGNLKIEISNDGTTYGGVHSLKRGDVFDLENLSVHKIRLTWLQNTSYRANIS